MAERKMTAEGFKQERDMVIRMLLAGGLSNEEANQVFDLAYHIVDKCAEALETVVDSAPDKLQYPVAAIAIGGCHKFFSSGLAAFIGTTSAAVDAMTAAQRGPVN